MQIPLTPLNWILSFLPILIIIILMMIFKWSGTRAAMASWVLTAVLIFVFFGADFHVFAWSQVKAILLAIDLLYIIWAALLLYNLAREVGTIERIAELIPRISGDRSIQILLISWILVSFLQSLGGFGVPVAVCAPILVGMGIAPLLSVVLTAVGHGWAVTYSSMATALEALIAVTGVPGTVIAPVTAILVSLCFIPTASIIAWLSTGRKGLKHSFLLIVLTSLVMGVTVYFFSDHGLWNLASVATSLAGLLCILLLTRLPFYQGKSDKNAFTLKHPQHKSLILLLPYILMVAIGFSITLIEPLNSFLKGSSFSLALPEIVTRLGFVTPADSGKNFHIFTHAGTVLIYAVLISSGVFALKGYFKKSAARRILSGLSHNAINASLGVLAMVGVATMMSLTGMTNILARGLSEAIPARLYPMLAPFIGVIGAFLTGSNNNSNVLFGQMQMQTAELMKLSVPLILAAQSVGASFGSIMSPAKIIVSCTTVGLNGSEGLVMRKLIGLLLALVFIVALAATLWTIISGAGA